jgi:H/ACA ribonucleoprotein complex subunit 2
MAKEIEEKKLKKEKKDKKEKKEKRAETDGVSKPKKEKKDKKSKDVTDALEAAIEEPEVSMMDIDSGAAAEGDEPAGALVPFAFPLADNDKEVKKILKTVKKCTSHNLHKPPQLRVQTAH